MAERPEPIVGIDLGTTYSVVAALDPSGRPMTIPNRHGDLSTPSVVLFEDDCLIVGKEAQRLALLEPDRVAECPKRDMGSRYYHQPVAGRQVPPQVISAVILKRLKVDAERRLGPIRRVVITVPAYFDHTRREATCQAAQLARLEVADLLNEPTAAALAYGFQEGFLDQAGAIDGRKTARKGVMTCRRLRPWWRDVRRDPHADPRPPVQDARDRRRRPPGRARLGPPEGKRERLRREKEKD